MPRNSIQFIVNSKLPDSILNIFKTYNHKVDLDDVSISIPATAREIIKKLHTNNKISRHVQELTDKNRCKEMFHLSFPMLAPFENIIKGRYIMKEHGILEINQIDYRITNDWVDVRKHLQFLYDWCESLYK